MIQIRAISQYRDYGGPVAQAEKVMVLATGDRQVLQKLLMAAPFTHGDLTEWERQAALEHWQGKLRGLSADENPLWRLSSFDTKEAQKEFGWTDEERLLVEKALVEGPGNGPDYIIVDRPKAPAPWPAYDKVSDLKKLLATVLELEVDIDHVLIYERENQNRPEVIEALEELKSPPKEKEELVEA